MPPQIVPVFGAQRVKFRGAPVMPNGFFELSLKVCLPAQIELGFSIALTRWGARWPLFLGFPLHHSLILRHGNP